MPRPRHAGGAGDDNELPGEGPPGGDQRIIDRRRVDRVWLPAYVIEDYGARLGPLALAVYVYLCHRAARRNGRCWPSLTTIAQEIGTSRSTVERSLRRLRTLRLVASGPRMDPWGQRSNVYALTDPEDWDLVDDDLNKPSARPVPGTGGPPPNERGAPSQRKGPPVAEKAPSEPGPREPGPRERRPPATAAPETPAEAVARLTVLWLELLVCPLPSLRKQHQAEIHAELAELVRRGADVDDLAEAMRDPARDRTEYPRVFRARFLRRKRPARPSKPPLTANELAERQAQAEKERAELDAFLAGQRPSEARRGGRRKAAAVFVDGTLHLQTTGE